MYSASVATYRTNFKINVKTTDQSKLLFIVVSCCMLNTQSSNVYAYVTSLLQFTHADDGPRSGRKYL